MRFSRKFLRKQLNFRENERFSRKRKISRKKTRFSQKFSRKQKNFRPDFHESFRFNPNTDLGGVDPGGNG
jgi:hypothetical protein